MTVDELSELNQCDAVIAIKTSNGLKEVLCHLCEGHEAVHVSGKVGDGTAIWWQDRAGES